MRALCSRTAAAVAPRLSTMIGGTCCLVTPPPGPLRVGAAVVSVAPSRCARTSGKPSSPQAVSALLRTDSRQDGAAAPGAGVTVSSS